MSSSSWGCELKYQQCKVLPCSKRHPPREDVSWNKNASYNNYASEVILLVRMWVEIVLATSMWNWRNVILLVRMWVEMMMKSLRRKKHQSSSSWGCELKYNFHSAWQKQFLSSSSWGCELKYKFPRLLDIGNRHPPREDVSWNGYILVIAWFLFGHPPREDVSWNITLSRM